MTFPPYQGRITAMLYSLTAIESPIRRRVRARAELSPVPGAFPKRGATFLS
jgi:hypothetical protein